jgi:molecular chaperone GrpE
MSKKEKELTVMEAVQAPAEDAAQAPSDVPAAEEELSSIRTEVVQLKLERDQLLDRLARLQAEFENAR